MKISEQEVNRLLAYTGSTRGIERSISSSAGDQGAHLSRVADRADVSSSAQEIQNVKKYILSLPDVREDRVQALKSQIESGAYRVSGEDIADLIIRRTLADSSSR